MPALESPAPDIVRAAPATQTATNAGSFRSQKTTENVNVVAVVPDAGLAVPADSVEHAAALVGADGTSAVKRTAMTALASSRRAIEDKQSGSGDGRLERPRR
jgi:hypothetical protein